MNLLLLFAEFCKIGLFSVGGGLAILPFLYELAGKYTWLDSEKVGDLLAVAQCSPGAIGINMGVQAGFLAAGIPGSLVAGLGLAAPSIAVIIVVSRVFAAFKANRVVAAVFQGLRPAAAGLLAAAAFSALRIPLYNSGFTAWYEILRWRECVLFAVIFILVRRLKIHPVFYIAAAGAAGALLGL
ncbi:MAG: chromate transporter [Treponema sp.]|jgi:chromate transporter|nr:chromate transporter [Treponema sp.]